MMKTKPYERVMPKEDFDLSKTSEQESKAEYYAVKEAMEEITLQSMIDDFHGIVQPSSTT